MEEDIKFVEFANNIISLEERKKEFGDDITDSIKAYASSHEISEDSVKKCLKSYKEWLKDENKFVETDMEVSKILNAVIYKNAPDAIE